MITPPHRKLYVAGHRFTLLLAVVVAALYTLAVCGRGIPALRHDWWWPVVRYAFHDSITNFSSGWIENGIGYPSLLPGDYLVGVPVAALGLLAGPYPTLVIFIFCIGLTIALGARSAGMALGASAVQMAAAEVFALFNPWVYAKSVAGHTFMLLAYGALLAIVAQALRPRPKPLAVSLLVALTVAQLQFFVVTFLVAVVIAIRKRLYLPLVTACVVASPLAVGYVMERAQLLQTPYLTSWQLQQSIDPLRAPVLLGYFTGYTDHLGPWATIALWCSVAAILAGIVFTRARKKAILIGVLTLTALIVSTGGRGPIAAPYMWTVAHVPFSAVFRELYDVLGFAAIGYVVLICVPLERMHAIGFAGAAAAIAVAAAWITYPPSQFWIDSRVMPLVPFSAPANSRFALIPAFQPMRFDGQGSGEDRDTYERPGNVTPLNEYRSTYPGNAALASYELHRDTGMLAALSVSVVVERPWLQSDTAALAQQLSGFSAHRASGNGVALRRLDFLPELTVGPTPQVGTLVNALGAGNILASDARSVRGRDVPQEWSLLPQITPVHVPQNSVDGTRQWVAAQFAFIGDPADAQGLGGVYTTNAEHPFHLHGDEYALVSISGTLESASRRIWRDTHGYAWIFIARGAEDVYCHGRCFIAAQAARIGNLPLNPPRQPFYPQPLKVFLPFLASARITTNAPLLRYNVRYDPAWSAYLGSRALPHMRIDSTVNGWLLPPGSGQRTVWLVQRTALVQFACECIAALWTLIVLAIYASRRPLTTSS